MQLYYKGSKQLKKSFECLFLNTHITKVITLNCKLFVLARNKTKIMELETITFIARTNNQLQTELMHTVKTIFGQINKKYFSCYSYLFTFFNKPSSL